MRQKKLYEQTLLWLVAALCVLFAYKCSAQTTTETFRVQSSAGLFIASASQDAGEICLNLAGVSGQIREEVLEYAGDNVTQRFVFAMRMAEHGAFSYRDFLRMNGLRGGLPVRIYYLRSRNVYRQVRAVLDAQSFAEIVHIVQPLK